MAAYGSQAVNKRQKTTTKEVGRNVDFNEFFPGNNLQSHAGNVHKLWDDDTQTQENYKRRLKAAFEFYYKLGVKYWTFEDRNVAIEGSTWEETCQNIDDTAHLVAELQLHTGMKPLWVTCDLNKHSRYRQGGFTNPESNIVATAAAQVKKGMEMANRLGAECFLVKDSNEGYSSILNTDMSRELRHYSRLLKTTADYKERLNFRGQLLFQPCSQKYNSTVLQHSYAPNALAALCLLRHYGLERHYKLDIMPSDEVFLASVYGTVGCLEIVQPFHYQDVAFSTLLMKNVIEQGGLQPGGVNIGIPNSRGMFDIKDMFAAYISVIDMYAQSLRKASKLISDGLFTKNLQVPFSKDLALRDGKMSEQRYLSFHTGFGSRLESGEADLEDCEDHIRRQPADVMLTSGQAEYWRAIFTHYL
ncbi:Xylose isomerase [Gryllus bimaculatus]|nr:Xylose isomerase [Gryllus bimaculatus]